MHAGGALPEQVEISAYYIVAEALTNAAKHAHASAVTVDRRSRRRRRRLRVTVRDDGVGGADFAHGTGLLGLKDRVEALGGRISSTAPAGREPPCAWSSRSPPRTAASPATDVPRRKFA